MSLRDRSLPLPEPAAPPSPAASPGPGSTTLRRPTPVERAAARAVLRRLGHLEGGELVARLPDGSRHRFGSAGDRLGRAEIDVHGWTFFPRLLFRGDLGAGEAYMDGQWSSPDLVGLVRLFLANEHRLDPPPLVDCLARWRDRMRHRARSNTRRGARRNIRAHYDLDSRFYALFLDPTMTYSSAVFASPRDDLAQAQRRKYLKLAAAAGIGTGDHVLEIGCGWGGFAELAAGELGCRVTAITLSEEQARFAAGRMRARGLQERVEIRLEDYRDVAGGYDAIVSIEMLEAVGHDYLGTFFAACDRLLRPGGRASIQTIAIPDQLYDRYRRGTDWIRSYIFPGGHLPSLGAIQQGLASHTSLAVERLEDIGSHYAETLQRWRRRFWHHVDQVRGLGFDDTFVRTWDFYLASCEAAFRHRKLADLQLVLARVGDELRPARPFEAPP